MENSESELAIQSEKKNTTKYIKSELKNFINLKSALTSILDHIKNLTSCEAVAIRLYDDEDYPYFVYDGFSKSFIKHENSLCAKDEKGSRISLPDGNGYVLECMCGNVIRGRTDPSLPFFTERGSFWTDNSSSLLASTTEEERQSRTRNYCNSCGYESVALIPLKAKGETIGLLQLNDMRKGMFTEDLVVYLEMICEMIGLGVQQFLLRNKSSMKS